MKVTDKIIKEQKMIEVESKVFTLDVSKEELVAIYAMAGRVIGGGRIREITDEIYSTIQKKLYRTESIDIFEQPLKINSERQFKELVDDIK